MAQKQWFKRHRICIGELYHIKGLLLLKQTLPAAEENECQDEEKKKKGGVKLQVVWHLLSNGRPASLNAFCITTNREQFTHGTSGEEKCDQTSKTKRFIYMSFFQNGAVSLLGNKKHTQRAWSRLFFYKATKTTHSSHGIRSYMTNTVANKEEPFLVHHFLLWSVWPMD